MSDFKKLIYASDLIEWIMETYPDWCVGAVRSIIDHVEGMSSAEPDESTCWGCNCPKMDSLEQPTQTNADSMQWSALDCVSRQQAIDALCNDYCGGHQDCKYYPNCENLKSIEQLPSAQPDVATDINVGDTISRQQAIDAVVSAMIDGADAELVEGIMELLPSAQPERDIPVKPIETTDKAWGIPARQAVCPKCDYYLGHVVFLGDYKGKRVTYCETCGQAIDWEGWNFDE